MRAQVIGSTDELDSPPWLQTAKRELGVKERPGHEHHPRIIQYFRATRYHAKADEVPWCAAFVCWCLETSGCYSTKSARAADFAKWGDPCDFAPGAIVVFGKSDPDAGGSGHVAFCVGVEGDCVLVLGGNQNNAVTVAKRPLARVVAVRWPYAH